MTNKIFDLLDDWRNLPAYQLERRADIIFALYLERIMMYYKKTTLDLIIPEFPLRLGELPNRDTKLNSSFKVDYLAYSKSKKIVYLIELKTDMKSRRTEQDEYYEGAKIIGLKSIIDGLIKIYKSTRQRIKYEHLMDKLVDIKWLIKESENTYTNIASDLKIEVIYIQPRNPFNATDIISFDDIICALSDEEDSFTLRFVKSLEKWKLNPNN